MDYIQPSLVPNTVSFCIGPPPPIGVSATPQATPQSQSPTIPTTTSPSTMTTLAMTQNSNEVPSSRPIVLDPESEVNRQLEGSFQGV